MLLESLLLTEYALDVGQVRFDDETVLDVERHAFDRMSKVEPNVLIVYGRIQRFLNKKVRNMDSVIGALKLAALNTFTKSPCLLERGRSVSYGFRSYSR